MRALFVAAVAVLALTTPAFAAALTPNEIQATFFNGQPFIASATNIKYKSASASCGCKMKPCTKYNETGSRPDAVRRPD
jgi:hypothetical protein